MTSADPGSADLRQLHRVLADGRFMRWFFNSMFVAVMVTLSNVFFDSLVGYTLAKFEFRGRYFIFLAILSTLMIPTEMLVIPWYLMSARTRLARQLLGHHVPRHDDGLRHLPDEAVLREACPTISSRRRASMASTSSQIFWKIAMPLVTPALSALAIFTFLGNWTAFFWPLIVTTSKELYTLPVGLSSFAVEQSIQWEMIMTGAALATLPTLIVFLVLQRYIVRGVMLAGLKG
jgi:multiple sugar transport system permease protein